MVLIISISLLHGFVDLFLVCRLRYLISIEIEGTLRLSLWLWLWVLPPVGFWFLLAFGFAPPFYNSYCRLLLSFVFVIAGVFLLPIGLAGVILFCYSLLASGFRLSVLVLPSNLYKAVPKPK